MAEKKTPIPEPAKAAPHNHDEYAVARRALLAIIEGNPVDTARAERLREARDVIGSL